MIPGPLTDKVLVFWNVQVGLWVMVMSESSRVHYGWPHWNCLRLIQRKQRFMEDMEIWSKWQVQSKTLTYVLTLPTPMNPTFSITMMLMFREAIVVGFAICNRVSLATWKAWSCWHCQMYFWPSFIFSPSICQKIILTLLGCAHLAYSTVHLVLTLYHLSIVSNVILIYLYLEVDWLLTIWSSTKYLKKNCKEIFICQC